ncbi:MAG: hypothetical protein OEZ23_06425 [Gammaproteobacteria bacterium]|nr:hypothetical protein [Gammaproteobacteria bacterium]
MTNAVHQMQMTYDPEEDRLLFRINTLQREEFRFWLTRRYTLMCLKILKEHLERDPDVSTQLTPEARQAVKAFKQEKVAQSADFSQQFSTRSSDFPLGEAAILAFKLSYGFRGEMMNLTIEPKAGKGVSLMLNRELSVSLIRLMLAAGKKAGWQLGEEDLLSLKNGETKIIN